MNKILVPTDFSEHSNYALEYAALMASKYGFEIYLLHISNRKDDPKIILEQLNKAVITCCSKDTAVEVVLVKGKNIAKTINQQAEKLAIDVIIMGSNGISNTEEMLLGSNTENVIRKSNFNVLTIKQKMLDVNVKSILFPSDFAPETYSIFNTVKEYAKLFGASIHLLRVNTPDDFEEEKTVIDKMEMLIEYFDLDGEDIKYTKAVYDDKNEELGIINYAIDNDLDLIAIGSHGKSVLNKLIHESTSQNIVSHSFRPILTIRFS